MLGELYINLFTLLKNNCIDRLHFCHRHGSETVVVVELFLWVELSGCQSGH